MEAVFCDNMEIIEEDLIIEETSEPMYTVDIKDENNYQSEEILVFHECGDCGYQIPTQNKSEDENLKSHNCVCSNGDQELTSDVLPSHDNDIICKSYDNVYETIQEAEYHKCQDSKSLRTKNNICQDSKTVLETTEEMESHQCSNIKGENMITLFCCPDCPKSFSSITMFQKHKELHKSKPNQVSTQKLSKEKKTNYISVTNSNHCSICNTTFSSQKNLKLHSKMHVKIQNKTIEDAMPIAADLCSKNKFFCEICNKSFNHSLLTVHQNMHQNIEEHNCSICNRQFENQVSYDMHMQLHADQPIKVRSQLKSKPGAKFACNYCGKEFLRPHEKIKHERIHTGEKPYECEVCGKSFRVSYSLTLHLRTHTDIRPFVCAQCNKRFKSYAVYSHHLNTHSEERPYKCPMCPKSFRTSVQLCGHKNSHTKPYNCPECNRPFSSLYAVKMHMKTHNKSNKSNENLKHRCDTCGAVYARLFALRFHMKEQHGGDLGEEETDNNNESGSPDFTNNCLNEDETSTQAILPGEEIIIENFQPEEIVTDWLTQK